jgi:PAS domain S-box-containing protein
MTFLNKKLQILIVEDNPGDYLLITEYLQEELSSCIIRHAQTFAEAKELLTRDIPFNLVFLDLSLPDAGGETLVNEMVKLAGSIPVVVLTGYTDKEFGIKTLSLGISDYLLKDELNASQLFKSMTYAIERSRIYSELKESEEKYRNIFQSSPIPMWVFDTDTLAFLDVNDSTIKHLGYSREEFSVMTLHQIWPEEEHTKLSALLNQKQEVNALFQGIIKYKKKNGEIITAEIVNTIIDFDGRTARLTQANDITEKLKSEQALKLSEQRFRALVQEGSDLTAILDINGAYKYVSPTSSTILGISAEQLIGENLFDFIHEDDKNRVMNQFKLLASQKRLHVMPFRFRNGENKWRWVETIFTNLSDDQAIEGIVANSRDVTESIENEIKLKDSVERYNIVAKATSDIIWDRDFSTGKITWNKGLQGVFGYPDKDQVTDVDWWYSKLHPDDRGRVTNIINFNFDNHNTRWQDEYRFQCHDGSYKYVFDRVFLEIDKIGKPIRMIGAMQDITQKKEEVQRLKLLESVITNTNDAVVITDADTSDPDGPKIVFVNNAFTEMTGYSEEETLGKTLSMTHGPKTEKLALSILSKALENREACAIEMINYKKNGEEFWMNMDMAPVSNGKGGYSLWIAIQRDVSERVNYIQAIEEQNTKLHDIAWTQSHIVRAPLARIIGFVDLLNNSKTGELNMNDFITHIRSSAYELDEIIRSIVKKTEQVENQTKNYESRSSNSR